MHADKCVEKKYGRQSAGHEGRKAENSPKVFVFGGRDIFENSREARLELCVYYHMGHLI